MSVTINGTTGVSLVQNGVLTDANMPSGSVIQVVQYKNVSGQNTSTTSSTYVATNVAVSITPSSTSSKILLIASGLVIDNIGAYAVAKGMFYRNGSAVSGSDVSFASYNGTNASGPRIGFPSSMVYLDSPSSTSALTYTIYIKSDNGNSAQIEFGGFGGAGGLVAMEIAG